MIRVLYFDCFSGISGDMALASLVDAGADRDYIEQEIKKLRLEGYTLSWRRVAMNGISALKADVLPDPIEAAELANVHESYSDMIKRIQRAGLSRRATEISISILAKIGAAEAKIHDIPPDEAMFQKACALDAMIDIVGVAIAVDNLQPDRILSSPVPLGSGAVRIANGIFPVPAPATLELMRGLSVAPSSEQAELTTPVGAAIIAALVGQFNSGLPPMIVEAIGYGAGASDWPHRPNVLRTVLGFMEKRLNVWPAPHAESLETPPAQAPGRHHDRQHNEGGR